MFMCFVGTFIFGLIHPYLGVIWFLYAIYKWDMDVAIGGAKVVKRTGADKWSKIWLDGRNRKKSIWNC